MAEENKRDRDMVLAPNEFMYVIDQTKGHVDVYVGPTKQSLSNTDQPVVFDDGQKRFRDASSNEAKQLMRTAPEGWYAVLKNPAVDGSHPTGNGKLNSARLDVGKKINVAGPVSFCLWPGQMAKIIKGHQLRSNQYLLGRVYDEGAARQSWKQAVVKKAPAQAASSDVDGGQGQTKAKSPAQESGPDVTALTDADQLTMGQLIIIKGTDVSFFIPPTGVEIVPDEDGELVREAVTLERLEYCLLQDENGNRRYEQGPAVIFPEPTEVFVEREAGEGEEPTRKFKAIELNENSGIYIKVIAEYEDEDYENPGAESRRTYKVGEELFFKGTHQMIYFPREEHAIVKYGKDEIHYGIAIPAGEARYVLDRNAGVIELVKGPKVFLPDPRTQVVVRRILDFKVCNLLFPNNHTAFRHNAALAGVDVDTYMSSEGSEAVAMAAAAMDVNMVMNYAGGAAGAGTFGISSASLGDRLEARGLTRKSSKGFSGASFDRKNKYTEPRSITLPTKFDGAVALDLYTGYAMMLVRKSGDRRVVIGPRTVLLEYDETPEIMELSTGKPKTTDNMMKTAYLRAKANKVSDLVVAQTSDYIDVEMKLSYRMDFTGDENKWFDVENYVKFMCDHLRSKLKSDIRKRTVEAFYAEATEIIRKIAIGADGSGTLFEENGMHVYDVEVLGVKIMNEDIATTIINSQKEVIKSSLFLTAERRRLSATLESEDIKRKAAAATAETRVSLLAVESNVAQKKLAHDIIVIDAEAAARAETISKSLENEAAANQVAELARERVKADGEAAATVERLRQALKVELTESETKAVVEKMRAVQPELVSALQAFSDRDLAGKAATALGPMTLLGGPSVSDIVAKVFAGTAAGKSIATAVAALASANGQGSSPAARS